MPIRLQSIKPFIGKTCAVTGHRVQALNAVENEVMPRVAKKVIAKLQPKVVITGMAVGWDQEIAKACLSLGVPYIAAVPFEGQEKLWPKAVQREYFRLLENACRLEYVCEPPFVAYKMHVRNKWMVDYALKENGCIASLWNGKEEGGTFSCLQYARTKHLSHFEVYPYMQRLIKREKLAA